MSHILATLLIVFCAYPALTGERPDLRMPIEGPVEAELISVIEGQLKASMSFNQLEESGTSKRTAAFHDLPDFDQEEGATPVMGIFPQTSPVSPPSSAFSNQFPEREAAETGGNGQSRFAFPPRSDEGMLPG